MATTPRQGLPYFWTTWLTAILAGEAHCRYAPWFRSHFKYDKTASAFDFAAWQVRHTQALQAHAKELQRASWQITREHQNGFKLTGKTAILAGKPDLVARQDPHVRVIDIKTGQPAHKDWVQVCVYQIVLPLVWERPTLAIEGAIVYPTHTVSIAWHDAQEVRAPLFALLRELATHDQPPTVPSAHECGWCDIAACPDRVTADQPEVLTEAF